MHFARVLRTALAIQRKQRYTRLTSTFGNRVMARAISEIEKEIRDLARPEQERLLRALLEELDGPIDPDADRVWLDEVQRRSADFDAGLVKPIRSEEVFDRVRARLKQ
jgi:putative addiction module component (TIGR02574 family)